MKSLERDIIEEEKQFTTWREKNDIIFEVRHITYLDYCMVH